MALETLRNVGMIGDFAVAELDDFADKRPAEFIVINHKNNGISFQVQNGAIKENGINGCQVDTLIEASLRIIAGLNAKFPCVENLQALLNLHAALGWLNKRTRDRENRNVEGTKQA